MKSRPLTFVFDSLQRVLPCNISVSKPIAPGDPAGKMMELVAVWDTGASHTSVSEKVISFLGLAPVGRTIVSTANGDHEAPEYIVCLHLPNQMSINVRVTMVKLTSDSDCLIGMDIIGLGDFAVTNFNNKTVFSFRFPSQGVIDFTNQLNPDGTRKS